MEGTSWAASNCQHCNLATEGGGKARAPAAAGSACGGSTVGGGDFDWSFPLTGIGGSLASSFSSLSSSSSSLGDSPPSQLTALVGGVMGVMTSVKTLGRHPVLATVLWLLGGSVEDGDKENKHGNGQGSSSNTSSSSSSNYHRQQARRQAEYRKEQQQQQQQQQQGRGQGSPDGYVRRLRWNANHGAPGGSRPEANTNDRIVYYVDRNGPAGDSRRGKESDDYEDGGCGWGHGLMHEDSQMLYPETIAVSEKITHMDRLEQDDLSPPGAGGSGSSSSSSSSSGDAAESSTRPNHHRHFDHHNNAGVGYLPHLHQHHDIGGGAGAGGGGGGHDDVSPQWGWYVTLTPPKPEFGGAGAAAALTGARARPADSLRPGMTTAASSS